MPESSDLLTADEAPANEIYVFKCCKKLNFRLNDIKNTRDKCKALHAA